MDCLKNGVLKRMWFGAGYRSPRSTDRGVSSGYICTNFSLYPPDRYVHNVRVRILLVTLQVECIGCVAESRVQASLPSSAAIQYMSKDGLK